MASQHPAVGNWYKDEIDHQLFEVVAIDAVTATIEIQYLDGDLAEFDTDTWTQLEVSLTQQPKDSNGPYQLPQDSQWGADASWAAANKDNPIAKVEPVTFTGIDEF
tara:strand:+ start:3073 stop:3390 length:318 start_codon:yes stop_codon:yes gene_type:complete